MPSSASTRSSCLAFIRVRARPASTCGSRCPAIIALIMSCAETVVSLEATAESLTSAPSSSFSSRCQQRVRSLDQPGPGPGVVPQVPDRLRRHERGAQQPHLGQPGQPLRVQLVGLRAAGQVPGLGRVDQLHRQPARLQHEEPDPPVVAGRFQRDDLDAVPCQLAAQRADRAPSGPSPSRRCCAGRRAGTGAGCGCTPSRSPSPRRSRRPAHGPARVRWSSITCGLLTAASSAGADGITAGCPGVPVGGHQARNTDRRARGNSARPSGQDPSARLKTGSHPKSAGVTGSPPPPSHAASAARTPARRGSGPARRDPHRPGFSRRATIPPDEKAVNQFVNRTRRDSTRRGRWSRRSEM